MIISRACNLNKALIRTSAIAALFAIAITGCGASSTTATAVPVTLDQTAAITPTATLVAKTAPPLEPDRLWGEKPFGNVTVGVFFYTDNGRRCVRILVDRSGAQIHAACAASADSVIAVQSAEVDNSNTAYTVFAGRALNSNISAISITLPGGGNTNSPIEDGGFAIILPGTETGLQVVPIDVNGNLVGSMYSFK